MKHVFIIERRLFFNQQWKLDSLLDSIGQSFRTQENPNFSVVTSKYPRDAIEIIQKQLDAADIVRVYAIGGDSILYDCLNGIVGLPNMDLAIVPYGVINNFIRSFGEGKTELFRDIQSLITASVIPTDIINVGSNYAINGCAVGFIPAVAARIREAKFENELNRPATALLRSWITLNTVFDNEIAAGKYTITIDNNDYSGQYSLVNVVNGPYFGRKKNAPVAGAVPDDGLLDVMLFKSAGTLSTWGSVGKYSRGKTPSNCVRVQAKKVAVHSDKPMWIQMDNEHLTDTGVTFEVVPQAVNVVAVNNLTYQRFLE